MNTPDQIIAVLICGFCAVPMVVLGVLATLAHRDGKNLRATILGLTFIHETALITFPGWYDAVTGFALETEIGVSSQRLLQVYIAEALYVMLFACALMLPLKKPAAQQQPKPQRDWLWMWIVIGGGVVTYIARMLSPSHDYEDIALYWVVTAKAGWLDSMQDWVWTTIQWPALIGAAVVLCDHRSSKVLRSAGLTILVAQLLYALIYGLRGGIVYVICIGSAAAYYTGQKKALLMAGGLTAMLVPIFPWLHSTMRYASYGAEKGTSVIEMVPVLLSGLGGVAAKGDQVSDDTSFLRAWADRAQGPRNSTTLLDLYDKGQSAGFLPMLGALMLPVPRFLWADKPVAGSTDGTNLGSAIYRVQPRKSAFYEMGPLLASAHAYWEGGWLGLVIAPVAAGLLWCFLLRWAEVAQRKAVDIIVLTFVAALPIDGFFSALNPLYTYCRLIWFTLIPLAILETVLRSWPERRTTAGQQLPFRRVNLQTT